jgi:hypothetical protein
VLSVDYTNVTALINIGFIILFIILVLVVWTSTFQSNLSLGIFFVMYIIISGAHFNALVRSAEYSLLYVVVCMFITTNYNITY